MRESAIMETVNSGGTPVTTVGTIDRGIYSCITPDIQTDEVVITDERIGHIKEHHPGDYEKIAPFLKAALSDPDYILEDEAHRKNTGLILKKIELNGLRFRMVLRLHTSDDPEGYKNSIISAWKISESRWNNYVNNKKVLYNRG